jgi:outer membrane protein TolC
VAAGDAAQIEVTRAESGVASSLQGILTAQSAVRRTQRDLKRIINRPDLPIDSATAIITTTQPEPLGLTLNADELANFAVTNRMEMLELELQLAIDASTIDFRRNGKLPLFTVDYNYNFTSLSSSYGNAFDQLGDFNFNEWTLAAQLRVPLGNEAAKSLYNQAILQRLQRLATKEQRETAIRQEVLDALDTLEESWQRILAARQESVLEGRTYQAEQRQFEVGLRTSTDVLDAAARLADAQSREVLALAEYQIAQIDIAFATGTLLGRNQIQWQPTELPTDQDG